MNMELFFFLFFLLPSRSRFSVHKGVFARRLHVVHTRTQGPERNQDSWDLENREPE